MVSRSSLRGLVYLSISFLSAFPYDFSRAAYGNEFDLLIFFNGKGDAS